MPAVAIDPCPHTYIGGIGGGWVKCYDCGHASPPGGETVRGDTTPTPEPNTHDTILDEERFLRGWKR